MYGYAEEGGYMVSFDHSKLKGRIREKGETLESLEKKVGTCQRSLSRKWNGKGRFTDAEIYILCVILDIPMSEVGAYFFAPKV